MGAFFFFFLGTSVWIRGCGSETETGSWDLPTRGAANVTVRRSALLSCSAAAGATGGTFCGVAAVAPPPLASASPTVASPAARSRAPPAGPSVAQGSPSSPLSKLRMLTYPSELVTKSVRPSADHAASVRPA